jgi:Flp pilus assembly protein TadG
MRRARNRSRGQALAEFAIAFPIFALILFGVIDLGRYVFTANQLSNAAREAARAVSVQTFPPDCNAITAGQREQCAEIVALNRAQGIHLESFAPGDIACVKYGRVDSNGDGTYDSTTNNDANTCRANDLVTVRIQHRFTLITPLISQFIGPAPIVGDAKVTVNS